jgi:UDP-N-acetylglucosamine diphosphorylase/glucosamine-1-phosphate N-acetyltransferase
MKELIVIIMAGGLGKRMQSDLPKVLHTINNKPMLVHIIEQAFQLSPKKIMIIVGKFRQLIEETLSKYISLEKIQFILQPEPLGTGNALLCCRKALYNEINSTTIILSGDTPCIKADTLNDIYYTDSSVNIVTTELYNPYGYGRIIETNGKFMKITEEKDCSHEEKLIKKINCGIYLIDTDLLFKYLPFITNENTQKEYYLTDIIEIIKNGENKEIDLYLIPYERQIEIIGVNTKEQLLELEQSMIPFCFEQKYEMAEKWL